MNVRTLIGESVHRAEDFRFLKGAGAFVDDLKRDGMLHAVVLRSPVAHGRIARVEVAAARATPGTMRWTGSRTRARPTRRSGRAAR